MTTSRRVKPRDSSSAMRFRFEPTTTEGLRVVPEIPSVSPCLIEGRNGIGKTVAIRLLELIAGRQPFEGAGRQWHSLRQRLGATVVRIDHLRDGEKIEFTFTPESWSSEGEPPLELGDWLGQGKINGNLATVAQVQALLWVERFAGNEDLDRTLRRRTKIYADHAFRTSRAVTEAVGQITSLLEPLRDELEPVDPDELAEIERELDAAEAADRTTREELAALVDQHEQVLTAIDARDRLRSAEDPSNTLQQRRQELTQRLKDLSRERDGLEARIQATSGELKRHGDAQATLGEAQRIVRYRQKRDRNIRADIERLAAMLGLDADVTVIAQEQVATRDALVALSERRRAIDAGGMTSQLIDTVAGLLTGPVARGLDDQILVLLPNKSLTVAEVRLGMAQRREQLRGEPKPDELEVVARETSELKRRLALLKDLKTKTDDARKQEARIQEAESEVERAEAAVERVGQRDEQYRTDNQRLGGVEEEIDSVTRQLTDVHRELGLDGGKSPEDARADLSARLEAFDLTEANQLDDLERDLRRRMSDARTKADRAAERVAPLRRHLTVVSASVDAAVSAMRADERFAWLRDVLPNGSAEGVETFARLRAGVLGLLDELEETRNLVEVVGQLADGALEAQPMVPDVPLMEAVRAVLADELRRGLDTPQIRKWLFGGARVESIHLAERELVLASNGISSVPRAFDTFSTGEQAFAFTQARVLELEPSNRPNRLLVLDEFGAFVAADRMPDLADFLRGPDVAPIADQVLVILPLQLDYEAELENTTGELRARFDARAKELRDRNYYTELLEA